MKEHYNFKIGDVVICKRLLCDMSKPIGGVVTDREYRGQMYFIDLEEAQKRLKELQ